MMFFGKASRRRLKEGAGRPRDGLHRSRPCVFAGILALTGCMVGPDYHKPKLVMPASFKEAQGWIKASPADAAPKGDWWTAFGDADLDRLEPLVAVNNATVAADYYAYEEAVQVVQETRGGLFPTVGLTGSATREGEGSKGGGTVSTISTGTSTTAGGTGTGGASGTGATTGGGTGTAISTTNLASGPRTSGSFEGSVDWTPDIWGKIRRQVEGDVDAAQVSAADLANATLSEQATLATDYVDLRAADAAVALYQATVAADRRSLNITQNQANAGVAAPSDVITAQTTLEGAQAQLINAGESRAQYEHAIAVLVGHAPAELNIPAGGLMQTVPVPPPGVPSTLLERRPDIAAAERMMAEQNAQVGVDLGAYYPDISLSALGGYTADPIGGLFNVANSLWSLGADMSATLFEGGTRSATVAAAQFAYDESVETYRQTVLSAFQDVENDLSDLRILGEEAPVEAQAVADAQRGVQIALNEYEAGTQPYTTVATAQLTLLGDQEAALTIQQDRLLASVALFEDLGGGFGAGDLPGRGEIQAKLPFLE
jgi:NodT family efflux transporter outer membrane factor (OMF) lipoprotein